MNPTDSTVLLVDDDPAILRILCKWLEKAGYSVRTAGDGQQALAAIEAECPDYLVTDWEMPNMNGLELCRRVRQLKLPHYVYILFLTVHSARDELIEGLEIGADEFLSKPVNQEELLARLRSGSRVLESERRLSLMARTDPLTGLMTQRTFYETLEREWHRDERSHAPISCVMLDLDFFKRVNDIHGHRAGDAVLKTVSGLLGECCRSTDSICRYGGEEVCVMLPNTDEHGAVRWAERTRQRLSSTTVCVGEKRVRVTGSFGVAQRCDDTRTVAELVDQADQALLCAKQSGRDRVVRYESLHGSSEFDLPETNPQVGLFQGIVARHVMTPLVAFLREDETVGQAAELFLRSRANSTPVVNTEGKLTGILSEKDLLAAMVSLECWESPVLEVMKPNVICYEENTPIQTIYEFICRVSIRRVVIATDGYPTGTISRGTLLRWFKNLVITKGLLDPRRAGQPDEQYDPHRTRERLVETARELAHQASELQKRLQEDIDDLVPYVVGGATGLEELVNDLLTYSRYANQSSASSAAQQAVVLDGGHID